MGLEVPGLNFKHKALEMYFPIAEKLERKGHPTARTPLSL